MLRPRPRCRREECSSCRSEEHTSELQSPCNLVCRLLLEKKKKCSSKTITSLLSFVSDRFAPTPNHIQHRTTHVTLDILPRPFNISLPRLTPTTRTTTTYG